MSASNTRFPTFSLPLAGGVSETAASESVAGSRRGDPDPVGPQFANLHFIS
jgi:hypothetical protein